MQGLKIVIIANGTNDRIWRIELFWGKRGNHEGKTLLAFFRTFQFSRFRGCIFFGFIFLIFLVHRLLLTDN
jgi:hypothetical protein